MREAGPRASQGTTEGRQAGVSGQTSQKETSSADAPAWSMREGKGGIQRWGERELSRRGDVCHQLFVVGYFRLQTGYHARRILPRPLFLWLGARRGTSNLHASHASCSARIRCCSPLSARLFSEMPASIRCSGVKDPGAEAIGTGSALILDVLRLGQHLLKNIILLYIRIHKNNYT